MGKIMEALESIGIELYVLAALKEHQLRVPFVVVLFVYAV
jgi:hypothetical protein